MMRWSSLLSERGPMAVLVAHKAQVGTADLPGRTCSRAAGGRAKHRGSGRESCAIGMDVSAGRSGGRYNDGTTTDRRILRLDISRRLLSRLFDRVAAGEERVLGVVRSRRLPVGRTGTEGRETHGAGPRVTQTFERCKSADPCTCPSVADRGEE